MQHDKSGSPHHFLESSALPQAQQQLSLETIILTQIRDSLTAQQAMLLDVRDRVKGLESKDFSEALERLAAVIGNLEKRVYSLEIENAKYKGMFMPVAILGSGFLAAVSTWIVNRLLA